MNETLCLGEFEVDVVLKDIKNVHLSVYPPHGRVRIAAPTRMNRDTLRAFALSKLEWIKAARRKLAAQEREPPRIYLDRESHYVWGERCLMKLIEQDAPAQVRFEHKTLVLQVRASIPVEEKHALVARWYRDQVRQALPLLIAKWEPLLGVKVARFFVQRMKTRWGSCNHRAANIRLNTELAKKPPECLEYVLLHEMVHLLEPSHNHRFKHLMDHFMPQWREHKKTLSRAPLASQDWAFSHASCPEQRKPCG